MRSVTADYGLIWSAIERDTSYEAYSYTAFLDVDAGDVIYVYDSDEESQLEQGGSIDDNRKLRKQVQADPQRFIELPEYDHDDHHNLLKEFLASAWTDDEQLHADALKA